MEVSWWVVVSSISAIHVVIDCMSLRRSVMAVATVALISSATTRRSWRFKGCAAAEDCERFLPEGLRLEDCTAPV